MSDLRDWLIATLKIDFGTDKEITSSGHGNVFQKWTGMSHKDLVDRWEWDGRYTTCTSFLSNVHGRITKSGYAGSPTFLPSKMALHTGWHSLAEYFGSDQSPQDGDFFLNTKDGMFDHVGLFLEVYSGYCTVIAGGGKGKVSGFDSIIRKATIFPLVNFVGWLNIDEFYA